MSKPPLPKSLLSAYFDGEVSAEERAAVSRAAQKSPAAQQVLDEYAQLSESLKSLRETVPSPRLRDTILASIQSPESSQSSPAREKPRVSPARALLQRRWVQVAGGILAASAAGLFLMVEFAGQRQENAAPFAAIDAAIPAVSPEMALARSEASPESVREGLGMTSEPGGERLAAAAAGSPGKPAENPDLAGLATGDSDESLVRTASIPADWYTQQVVHDDRTPQPGDVMTYLRRVADETVVIPVTVVDVQMTAGQIRLLLAQHGIQSLPMEKTKADGTGDAAGTVDASSVAILVESDWGRFSAVMDDLDTEGMGVATSVDWSPASRQAMMKQSSNGTVVKPAVPGPPLFPSAAPTSGALLAESTERGPTPDTDKQRAIPADGRPAPQAGMFLQAPVTDDFVAELGQRQQSAAPDSAVPAIAESSDSDRRLKERASPDSDGTKRRKFGVPFASHGPARVVFLIKKSGNAP